MPISIFSVHYEIDYVGLKLQQAVPETEVEWRLCLGESMYTMYFHNLLSLAMI